MSLYNYVDTPNNNLVCCICRTPFTDPATTRTCAHTFCQECILQALSHSPICPVDRSPLSLNDLEPANPIVRSLVDELVVECTHRLEGCEHTCQRHILASHLREECLYSEVQCLEEECEEFVKRGEMEAHLKEHGESSESREQEEEQDAAETKKYPEGNKNKESLPSPQERQITLLTEQNLLLRHRVGTLESTVQTMRKEMVAVKSALGPWYRPEGYIYPSTELPSSIQPYAASSSSAQHPSSYAWTGQLESARIPENVIIDGIPAYLWPEYPRNPTSVTAPDGTPLDYASFFPPESELIDYPSALRRPSNPGHRVHSSEHMQPNTQQVPGYRSTTIAPLNLGTSLEGALGGLRESVVSLAMGMDSLGRRSEIALTNETMRLGEEVMSLRAGLHGLRMQVHAMMVERNALVTGRPTEGTESGIMGWMPGGRFAAMQGGQVPPSITKL
ncbi:hypothetical protein BDQ12DRAFT_640921 [Crucibulum laeve]|uniref:RING-type domain-containing protein n=1 Tax=Crucibulum laeve TaxID=68775 RepID=A0A5C3MI39_9AGAR|nr:hypothetical protein BDQ12DRAFT_640921 [Crucibulum laeve]